MSIPRRHLIEIEGHLATGGRLLLTRHGNAAKAAEGARDEDRRLTPKGIRQAQATRDYLTSNYMIGLVVTSFAERAVETVTDPRWSAPIPVVDLYLLAEWSEEDRIVDEAFDRLLYVPLTAYFAEPGVEHALIQWGNRAAMAIEEIFAEHKPNGGTVVVGGHAPLLNALAVTIARQIYPCHDISVALEIALGEAECIEMKMDIGGLRLRHLSAADLGHPAD